VSSKTPLFTFPSSMGTYQEKGEGYENLGPPNLLFTWPPLDKGQNVERKEKITTELSCIK
jgi:hypothetical protein